MAERLEGFEFKNGHAIYDWETWLNGEVWKLTRGVDFQISAINFRTSASAAATKRGKNTHARIIGDEVILQAYTKDRS